MSRFYGTLSAERGTPRTRGATKEPTAIAASHNGSVYTRLYLNSDGQEWVNIFFFEPWRGAGCSQVIYDGPLCGDAESSGLSAIRCRTCVNGSNWEKADKELAKFK